MAQRRDYGEVGASEGLNRLCPSHHRKREKKLRGCLRMSKKCCIFAADLRVCAFCVCALRVHK